jgi:flavin reductase (DIM6/NTAB) family NADH-FMN oxidoreductase RutF
MQTKPENLDPKRQLRSAFGRFPTGVAIVTALDDYGWPVGMTINSLVSISLSPALLGWSIDHRSSSYEAFTTAKGFAVTVLADTQTWLAMRFAKPGISKFLGLGLECDSAPVIPDGCAWYQCETWKTVPLGDHTLLVGKIVDYDCSALPPLVFLDSRFQTAQPEIASSTDTALAAA